MTRPNGQQRQAKPAQRNQEGDVTSQSALAGSEDQDVLLDRTVFPLTELEYRQFEKLLDSAPVPNKVLREFVRQRPPWDLER